MPIQFHCDLCDQLLETPDVSARKRIRCPACRAVVTVPVSSQVRTSSGTARAPAASTPASFTDDHPGPATSTTDLTNPYAAPSMIEEEKSYAGTGLAWESSGVSPGTYWATAKMILFSPANAFDVMPKQGGYGKPMLFAVVGTVVGSFFAAIYNQALERAMMAFLGTMMDEKERLLMESNPMFGGSLVFAILGVVVGAPLVAIISTFVGAAILHVLLILVKGARYEYETTYRVVAYTAGAIGLLSIIPILGALVSNLVSIVYLIIGIYTAHRTDQWRAVVAVLVPQLAGILLGCGIGMLVGIVVMTMLNSGSMP